MAVEERAKQQYADDSRLNARIQLHRRFSTSAIPWSRWVFDQMQLRAGDRVVELGAGTGALWAENAEQLPDGMQLVLTEPSAGMLRTLRAKVAGLPGIEIRQADASHIHEPDHSADVVVANHMLYEVPDRLITFREVLRVLKPSGRFFAATNGLNHMRELNEAIGRPDQTRDVATLPFSLENGGEQLRPFFKAIRLVRQDNMLAVTDAEAAVAYVRSLPLQLAEPEIVRIRRNIEQEIGIKGSFRIRLDSGMYICGQPVS